MKNQKKILIGAGIGLAALAGYFLWNKNSKKVKTETSAGGGNQSAPDAVAPKEQGKYSKANIKQEDIDYIRSQTGNTTFSGVDYNDIRNTTAANAAYLAQNPDVVAGWADKAKDGSTFGWSHYVIWGQKEGRIWPTA